METNDSGLKTVLTIFIIVGTLLVGFGTYSTRALNTRTQSYVETVGIFIGTDRYSEDSNRLVYSYMVDGVEYTVATDYGTSIIPSRGSTIKILYNPNDPSAAVIRGMNGNILLIAIGTMFVLIPGMVLLGYGKTKMKIQGIVVGVVLFIVGFGLYYIVGLQLGTFNILEMILRGLLAVLVSIVFAGIGIWTIFSNVFAKNKSKEIELKIIKISNVDGKYVIRFEDRSVLGTNLFQMASKFFIYSTSNSLFREGEIYRTDLYKHGVMFNAIQIDNITARTLEFFNDSDFIRIGYEEPPIKIEEVKPTVEEKRATGKTDAELIMERDFKESVTSPFNQFNHNITPIVEKMQKTSIIIFFVFWFGFLVVFCTTAFVQGAYGMIAFSSIFWIVGIWQLIAHFKH